MERIEQIAREGYWLCTDLLSDDCLFAKKVLRAPNTPAWDECTDAEKIEWEETHKPEETE